MDIKEKVNKLVAQNNTTCPFTLAASLGIQIHKEHLGNILGYYTKNFRVPIIHINESVDENHQIFICSHELGHAVLHTEHNTSFLKKHTFFSTDKLEMEANVFAIELLLLSKDMSYLTITEAIEEYGIPEPLIKKLFS